MYIHLSLFIYREMYVHLEIVVCQGFCNLDRALKKLQQRESLFKFHFLLEITTDAEMLYIFSNFPSTLLNNW